MLVSKTGFSGTGLSCLFIVCMSLGLFLRDIGVRGGKGSSTHGIRVLLPSAVFFALFVPGLCCKLIPKGSGSVAPRLRLYLQTHIILSFSWLSFDHCYSQKKRLSQ